MGDDEIDCRKSETVYIKEASSPGCYVKARHSLAVLEFFGMVCLVAMRNNLTIAIVAMVNATALATGGDETAANLTSCPGRGNNQSFHDDQLNGQFAWNTAEQGFVLGCYFYGYIASNSIGACLSNRFGIRYVIGVTSLLSSVLTLCTPWAAYYNFWLLVFVRVTLGLLHGVVNPSMVGSWGVWAPAFERSSLISFFSSGTSVGACLSLLVSGLIAQHLGWETVFQITGGCGMIWSFLWLIFAHDSPHSHPRISKQEKLFIVQNRSCNVEEKYQVTTRQETPWRQIFTSVPFLAICVAQFASNWVNFAMQIMLPTYISTVLNFNISTSGFLSALPYLLKWMLMIGAGYLTDKIMASGLVSLGNLRKANQTTSLTVSALFVVLAGYVGCDATSAIAFLCVSVGFNALSTPGCVSNTVDIAPRYAGILFGIGNAIGCIPGFLAPQVIGWILLSGNSIASWQIAFWVSAAVSLLGAFVFLLFASGEEQPWAKSEFGSFSEETEDMSR